MLRDEARGGRRCEAKEERDRKRERQVERERTAKGRAESKDLRPAERGSGMKRMQNEADAR